MFPTGVFFKAKEVGQEEVAHLPGYPGALVLVAGDWGFHSLICYCYFYAVMVYLQ